MSVNATGEPTPTDPDLMFAQVGPDTIHPGSCFARVALPEAGAVAQFCGLVRNHNQGAQVVLLEYDAYPEMAEEVILEIMQAAHQQWAFRRASAVHRTGRLALGDVAVCVTVSSDHRDAAMQACRFIIDRLKAEAPIWKRETLKEGAERWVEESRPGQAGKGA